MGILVDLVIIQIIAVCVFLGYRRGLARCLLKIVTSVLAIIIAVAVHKPFVDFIVTNTTIDDNIAYSLERVFADTETDDKKIIDENSNMPKPIKEYLNNNVQKSVEQKKEETITSVSKSASIIIVNIGAVLILYFIAKILLQIIVIFADIITKLPLINPCNKIGGIIYGVIEAFTIILIILTIISILTPLIGDYVVSDIIMKSFLGKFLYDNNIILNLIF